MLIVAGDFGGIHKSTCSRIVTKVSAAIASLAHLYIKMPQNNVEVIRCKQAFFQIASFPNVIGTIDCTHVRIQSPGNHNKTHICNKIVADLFF